jgi:hypothetical protein
MPICKQRTKIYQIISFFKRNTYFFMFDLTLTFGFRWISSDDELHWTRSKIATFNPAMRTFKCSECDFDGSLTRVGEHWIETHANLRVYQCPQCPYTSAWARCVRMHIAKQHSTEDENNLTVKIEPDEDHYNTATNNPSTSPIPSSLWKVNPK